MKTKLIAISLLVTSFLFMLHGISYADAERKEKIVASVTMVVHPQSSVSDTVSALPTFGAFLKCCAHRRGPRGMTVPETPTSARSVLLQEPPVHRYQNRKYRRASAIQPLREILDLPAALADDLDVLVKRASVAAKTVPDLDTEGLLVKCYSGVNHLHHGLLENGVGELFSRPAPGVYFTEHCFDKDGKLVKAIANQKDGTRFVSRAFLYEDDQPAGMLTFGPNGHSFSDLGLYKEGRLSDVARIAPAGNVMSCECTFYTGDHEDYSVSYVATRTGAKFAVSDLDLDAIYLHGNSRLQVNATGDLKRLWLYYPKEDKKK